MKSKRKCGTIIMQDWKEVNYVIEISYVAFCGGWIVWIDDEPWDDNVFHSWHSAEKTMRRHLK